MGTMFFPRWGNAWRSVACYRYSKQIAHRCSGDRRQRAQPGWCQAVVVYPAALVDPPALHLGRWRLCWRSGDWVVWLRRYRKVRLEIVKRSDAIKGFIVLPHKWIVERTFGWVGKDRWVSKDYEYCADPS